MQNSIYLKYMYVSYNLHNSHHILFCSFLGQFWHFSNSDENFDFIDMHFV